ncbi:DUF3710 domain-containing protein [Streptomyces sp. D2-8]|uniref:DUF3710 domain-containing protein n=1 Tax=Streptomyces sp. D2-8 TaxID=2707767 RepID=UPI0020BEBCF1|nr:DUF3710 domain-containing protein [Streptomyces sp. D2-8]MCK8438832.1 DUF3710 domain-containing protein [Streptomyces sp. D2-8]
MTKALTLRELEERFKYGRTQWGQFRKGAKVLPSWFVSDLVRALVKPQAQQAQLKLGLRLQKAAEAAAVAREARNGSVPMGTEGELQLRLDQARKATIEAQKTLMGTTQLVYMLLQLVTSLQSRCEALERERDRATAQAASLDLVQRELEETKQKVVSAKKKLKRARQTREAAEELNVTAEVTAARHEFALESVRAASLETSDTTDDRVEESSTTAADTRSVVDELRPLWEYDADLEVADQQMEAHEAELDELRAQMGIDASEDEAQAQVGIDAFEGEHVLRGMVVREEAADNPAVPEDGGYGYNAPGQPGQDAMQRMREWVKANPNRPPDAPRDIARVEDPAPGRLHLGALYVPEVQGVRLHFGLLDGKPVGLIAEIDDYHFEIQVLKGAWDGRSWSAECFDEVRRGLEQRGQVSDWDHGDLLPGWGPSLATSYSVPSTVSGRMARYQLCVTGCDGPGWVLRLTYFRSPFSGR